MTVGISTLISSLLSFMLTHQGAERVRTSFCFPFSHADPAYMGLSEWLWNFRFIVTNILLPQPHNLCEQSRKVHVSVCFEQQVASYNIRLAFPPSYRPVPPSRAPPFAGLYRLPGLPLTPALNGFKTTAPSPIANTMLIEPVIVHIK